MTPQRLGILKISCRGHSSDIDLLVSSTNKNRSQPSFHNIKPLPSPAPTTITTTTTNPFPLNTSNTPLSSPPTPKPPHQPPQPSSHSPPTTLPQPPYPQSTAQPAYPPSQTARSKPRFSSPPGCSWRSRALMLRRRGWKLCRARDAWVE